MVLVFPLHRGSGGHDPAPTPTQEPDFIFSNHRRAGAGNRLIAQHGQRVLVCAEAFYLGDRLVRVLDGMVLGRGSGIHGGPPLSAVPQSGIIKLRPTIVPGMRGQ